MATKKGLFDKKFGPEFIGQVPLCPGVYEMLDPEGKTIYVGKAKLLRRRLQQYRNAKRCRKHHKMRSILDEASSIRLNPCASDLDALLLENKLIQILRPKFNVAGAFSFLYPVIGIKRVKNTLVLCYTNSVAEFSEFQLYGCFRSRDITRAAYFGLTEIMSYLGHREPRKKLANYPVIKYSYVSAFRQTSDNVFELLDAFLKGHSNQFLEFAVAALLEKASARRQAEEVQTAIDDLVRFSKFETKPLKRALAMMNQVGHFISQEERDCLFLNAKHTKTSAKDSSKNQASLRS